MRVAYLVNLYPAVSHTFIRREIHALERQGIEVLRVSIRAAAPPFVDPADDAELPLTRCLLGAGAARLVGAFAAAIARRPRRWGGALGRSLRLGRRSHRGTARHLAYLAEAALLARWIESNHVQHIHAHFGTNPAAVALLASHLTGVPYSFTAHGPEEFLRPRALRIADKARAAEFVIAVTEDGERRLRAIIGPDAAGRIRLVRCGIDAAFLNARPKPVPAEPRFVCVGRLCPEKQQDALIRAAAALRPRHPRLEVSLIGDGPTRPRLEALADRLHAPVRFLGSQGGAAIREHLHASRALVLPSRAEGLPSVLMEAFALERPVITTPVGGIPELVSHGENGWLVSPGSLADLAAAMDAAITASPDALQAMARRGRAAVLARHDADQQGAAIASLLLSSHAHRARSGPAASAPGPESVYCPIAPAGLTPP